MKGWKQKKKVFAICLCAALALGTTACSEKEEIPEIKAEEQQDGQNKITEPEIKKTGDSENSAFLFENADLQGTVADCSDAEITISLAVTETTDDGGEVMMEAAPGMENEDELVHVAYADNTVIQLLVMDRSSQTQVSLSNSDKSGIEKQSSTLVFGSCQDTHHWTADKIVIVKWQ